MFHSKIIYKPWREMVHTAMKSTLRAAAEMFNVEFVVIFTLDAAGQRTITPKNVVPQGRVFLGHSVKVVLDIIGDYTLFGFIVNTHDYLQKTSFQNLSTENCRKDLTFNTG